MWCEQPTSNKNWGIKIYQKQKIIIFEIYN